MGAQLGKKGDSVYLSVSDLTQFNSQLSIKWTQTKVTISE